MTYSSKRCPSCNGKLGVMGAYHDADYCVCVNCGAHVVTPQSFSFVACVGTAGYIPTAQEVFETWDGAANFVSEHAHVTLAEIESSRFGDYAYVDLNDVDYATIQRVSSQDLYEMERELP